MQNVRYIVEGSKVIKYTYDSADRLIREDNEALGKTYTYQYDTRGNITTKTERDFDLDTSEIDYPEDPDTDPSTDGGSDGGSGGSGGGPGGGFREDLFMAPPMYSQGASTVTNYTYSSMGVLTSVVRDGQTIHSQTISGNNFHANTCNWLGNVLQWTRGRQLASFGNIASYRYDASGIRIEKTVGNTLHRYYTEGSRIHKETRGNNTLWYYYDGTGIIGMDYNGTRYYFHKNIQGDVVRILTANGDVVASYVYDAWGNHTIGTNVGGIADINPFRYRGYYYDVETSLYYLQSRYYDPSIGRFLNADSIDYLDPESINGLNLYAYCLNNPVMNVDPNGNKPTWWQWALAGVGAILVVAACVVLTVGTAGLGGGLVAAVAVGVAKGALIGAAVGTAVGVAGGAIYAGVTGADMGDSILSGAMIGFGAGAIIGAVVGGAVGGIQYSSAVSQWGATSSRTAEQNMLHHFNKHVIEEGHTYLGKNVIRYTKNAKSFFSNNTSLMKLTTSGNYSIRGMYAGHKVGGFFSELGFIFSFF